MTQAHYSSALFFLLLLLISIFGQNAIHINISSGQTIFFQTDLISYLFISDLFPISLIFMKPYLKNAFFPQGLNKDKEKNERKHEITNSFWVYSIGNDKWTCFYRNENNSSIYWNKMQSEEPRPRYAHQLVYDEANRVSLKVLTKAKFNFLKFLSKRSTTYSNMAHFCG